ncbi:MAG: hypothetical protein GY816_14935 [Cytophagales bacterium]|nr:hypothetical protein [Cytophagales bacterium]
MAESNSAPAFFHDAYYKARRWLGVYSGLLFVWTVIGLKFDENKPLIANLILKNPENQQNAIPVALTILILFYSFRFHNEWKQANSERKELGPSKEDRAFTISMAVGSMIVFLINIIFDWDIAKYWKLILTPSLAFLILINTPLVKVPYNYFVYRKGNKKKVSSSV